MSQFFTQLSAEMSGSSGKIAAADALSVLAAFLYARVLLSPDQLATALGWPIERINAALSEAASSRLTTAQREALDRERLVTGATS